MERHIHWIAKELQLPEQRVKATVELLVEGNTIPFIARYRKEMTGNLDETIIRTVADRYEYLKKLAERKTEVLASIEEQGKLSAELQKKIEDAVKLQEVEDLYLPYRPKRKTRASVAKEKGCEPLAKQLFALPLENPLPHGAEQILSEQLPTVEEAIAGAQDIIAEWIAEDAEVRQWIREVTWNKGKIRTEQKKEEEGRVYQMYYEYEEGIAKIVPHRILAINRGEKEEILRVTIDAPIETIMTDMQRRFLYRTSPVADLVEAAMKDAYKRLIAPAIERDIRNRLTDAAEEQAIQVFSKNLRSLLLQPPLRRRRILGVDPAFRTGCKLAMVDETGKLLAVDVIYPTAPHFRVAEAKERLLHLIHTYDAQLLAIGNGTASRETEQFVAQVIREEHLPISYVIVNEAGASVYSASPLAKEEFPDLDVSERSAASIARRVQDPLAELVKIEPKAIGVGQYQHDVTPSRLQESLLQVVESVVNYVGVNLNTASSSLLQYVADISTSVANNIVAYRDENGPFQERKELLKVPRLGPKTYEQAVGFLRILHGREPFDATPIHPESYPIAAEILASIHKDRSSLGTDELKQQLKEMDWEQFSSSHQVGIHTLRDIVDALIRPQRDPRDELPQPLLRQDVLNLEDLTIGMELQGTVRNVVDFGAFVDIGLKNDGLVHISKLSHSYVRHPLDVVQVGDIVQVWVDAIDQQRGKVNLSLIEPSK